MWSSQSPEICQRGRNLEKKQILGHSKALAQIQIKKKCQPTQIRLTKAIFEKSELKKATN